VQIICLKLIRMKVQKYAFQIGKEIKFIEQKEIMHCTSDSNYTDIAIVSGKRMLSSKSLKELEKLFDSDLFVRVHNSCIVNITYVVSFSNEKSSVIVMADGTEIKVSRRKKRELLMKFHKL